MMEQKQQIHAQRLGQSLAVAVALGLVLLIVGAVGVGAGIQHGDIRPPEMDVSFSGLHIVAYTTDPIECRPALPCQGSFRDYYVFWVFRETAPNYVHETWHRILTVPVQR